MARKKVRKNEKVKTSQREMSEAMALRKKNRLKRRRRFFGVVLVILLCIGLYYISGLDYFVIEQITTQGNEHYKNAEIIKKAQARTGDNMFRILLSPWKDNLQNDPYISSASVRRKLPDTVAIEVTERKEKYAAAYKGKFVIIDEEAVALRTASEPEEYVVIDGIDFKEVTLGEKMQDEGKLQNTDKALSAVEEFEKEGIPIKKITMDDLFVTIHIYDKLVFKTEYSMLSQNTENLKGILLDLKERGIERGTIKGQDGDLAFSPHID